MIIWQTVRKVLTTAGDDRGNRCSLMPWPEGELVLPFQGAVPIFLCVAKFLISCTTFDLEGPPLGVYFQEIVRLCTYIQ